MSNCYASFDLLHDLVASWQAWWHIIGVIEIIANTSISLFQNSLHYINRKRPYACAPIGPRLTDQMTALRSVFDSNICAPFNVIQFIITAEWLHFGDKT